MERKKKYFILINRYFPSSKLFSKCSFKKKNLELKDREIICPECNAYHDKDVNAYITIRNE